MQKQTRILLGLLCCYCYPDINISCPVCVIFRNCTLLLEIFSNLPDTARFAPKHANLIPALVAESFIRYLPIFHKLYSTSLESWISTVLSRNMSFEFTHGSSTNLCSHFYNTQPPPPHNWKVKIAKTCLHTFSEDAFD